MSKKQTAVEWLINELTNKQNGNGSNNSIDEIYNQAIQMEREQMIDLVQSLKDYTYESHNILGHDEREASDFVDIYYTQTYGECTQQ